MLSIFLVRKKKGAETDSNNNSAIKDGEKIEEPTEASTSSEQVEKASQSTDTIVTDNVTTASLPQRIEDREVLPTETENVPLSEQVEEASEYTADNILIDVTAAKLPSLWQWLTEAGSSTDDDHTVSDTKRAVRIEKDGAGSTILKSISIVGRRLKEELEDLKKLLQTCSQFFFLLKRSL